MGERGGRREIGGEKAVDPLSTLSGERVLVGVQEITDLLQDPEYKPALLSCLFLLCKIFAPGCRGVN